MKVSVSIAAAFALVASALPACAEGDYVLFGAGLNLATFSMDLPSGARAPDQSNRIAPVIEMGYQSGTYSGDATVVTLGYEGKGAVWEGSGDDVTIKFDYLQLGFKYKILMGQASGPRFYLAPGFGAALLVSSEASSGSESVDVKNVTSFDIDLAGVLGVQVPAGKNAFFIEGGYGYGLLDTDDSAEASINNSVIKLRVGFLLGS
jgi:hypothetical protein